MSSTWWIQELSPILLFRRHPLCCFCDPLCCFCVPLCWSVCPFCWFGDPFCCFCSTKKQQSGNLQSPNARGGTECRFCIWVESTFLVVQKPRINDSCWSTFLVVKKKTESTILVDQNRMNKDLGGRINFSGPSKSKNHRILSIKQRNNNSCLTK